MRALRFLTLLLTALSELSALDQELGLGYE